MGTIDSLDRNSLLIQAENYKTFLQLHPQLAERDRLLKEQVVHRMGMLQSTVIDLERLERTNNQTEYEQSLDRANRVLQGVKVLIEYMLHPDNPPDGIFQNLAQQ